MEKYEVMWSGGDGADYMLVDIDGDIVTVEVEPPFDQCITPEDDLSHITRCANNCCGHWMNMHRRRPA